MQKLAVSLKSLLRGCALLLLFASSLAWSQTSLVPSGSIWKFLDNGSNQGTAWRAPSFDDSAWASGAAQLGYGDGDETSVIGYGPSANAKYITTYFRRSFNVANPAALSALNLRVKRDDGIVVYLNGTEVYRSNVPAGSVTYTTLAMDFAEDDGATWQTTTLSGAALLAGTNVLAAEVHQAGPDSSDTSFDLELTGAGSIFVSRAPYLQLGTSNSVVARWRTNAATDSRVWYGAAPTSLTASVTDATQTTEHSVTLTGLSPDTKYFYSVGSSTQGLAGGSANHYFVTSPAAGSQRATRIWVVGDAGTGSNDQARVRDAYYNFTGTTHTDLWLQLGDNAYQNGTDGEYQAAVFDVYGAMLSKSVTWPTIGNHDTAQSASPPASLPYFQMFNFPTAGQAGGVASGSKNYFSFDFGNIHFINLDSMASSRAAGSAMLNWLQNDLAANSKDWTIAFWHHPPYTKGSHDSDVDIESIEMRQNALPILESFGVDLVLSGHSHDYQRSYLIDGHYGSSSTFASAMKKNGGSGRPSESGAYAKPLGTRSRQGAVYSVAGSSGKIEGGGALNHPAMFISLLELGSMVLDVNGNRLDAIFLSDNGVVRDSFTISKAASANQAPAVTLSAPTSGATGTAPASFSLAANASDADGSIQRVEFYQGSTLLGSDTSAPYTFVWGSVPAGSYSLSARAYDNLGAATTSAAVSVTVNPAVNQPPAVMLSAPTAGASAIAPATINFAATASDADGSIQRVEFYQGSTLLGSDTSAPYTFIWGSVPAGSYSLSARAYDNLGAATTSAMVNLTVNAAATNQPPAVALTAPAAGATSTAPATINLAATASDADGSIQRVEFYQGSTLLGSDTSAPYTLSWGSVPAGSYALSARAYDNLGAATTSAAATITVNPASTNQPVTLIGKGAVWKYLDNGSNQGTAWRATAFNDAAWASGAAQLGYGDGDEATVVSYGPNASARYVTTYFRKTFNVADPSQFTSLLINLVRDDGAVVYLNGTRILRSNMPSGTITSSTLASTAVTNAAESTYLAFSAGTATLLAGTNVIAVEIHQASGDSSDISFDLELIARP